jgi:DNA processing protein
VSGLAYGVDITGHKAALDNGLPTIGVVGHGLDRIYPAQHAPTAKKMLAAGGLLTEYPSNTIPDRENFPSRNRIVAGICDAVVIVETDIKGGSMITADIAFDYNRDVFAIPGRSIDERSKGCNHLIRTNKAALIENAADIANALGWDVAAKKKPKTQLNLVLNENEGKIYSLLKEAELGIDEIAHKSGLGLNEASLALLEMELNGVVKSLPGKMYRTV